MARIWSNEERDLFWCGFQADSARRDSVVAAFVSFQFPDGLAPCTGVLHELPQSWWEKPGCWAKGLFHRTI